MWAAASSGSTARLLTLLAERLTGNVSLKASRQKASRLTCATRKGNNASAMSSQQQLCCGVESGGSAGAMSRFTEALQGPDRRSSSSGFSADSCTGFLRGGVETWCDHPGNLSTQFCREPDRRYRLGGI